MINHPNIVTLKEIFFKDQILYLVYEKLDKDLYGLIEEKQKANKRFDENEIRTLMY
jgi:serine/threonine protein kinase